MMGLLFILSGIWLQDGKAPEFTKFDFIRERIAHKVLVEGILANTTGAELADVKLTSIYYDGNRELRRSKTARIAKVASGTKADFTLEAEQVPNFTRYELYVEYGGITRLYGGDEKAPMPALRKAAGANLSLVSSKDAPPKSFPGDVVLTVVVKNDGGSPADEPTVVLGFKVRGQEQLVRVVLDRSIAPGNEDTFDVTIHDLEAYSSYESRVTFVFAEGPRPADPPPNVKEVVVRSLRMVRMADGSGRVSGSFKNGLAVAVGEVSATFQVGKTDVPFALPGTMAPGEQRPFELYVPSCPAFDGGGGYDLGFKEVPKAEPAGAARAPSVKKTGTRAVETRQIKLPPLPVKDKNNDPELNAKTRIKDYAVGVRGLMYVQGNYLANGKYTGDVYLMRMIFLDDDGKPMKPTPTINMTVYNKDQAWGKVQRIIGREMWNIDATKINSGNVADNTVACDKKTGELWVAFVRTDGPNFEPRADMTVVIPDLGTWSWKGLSGKFEVAAKTADSPR
ncbi:MAG TPA: hypothetical protein VNM14_12330 [Planctomycetota bacterium]|nr:hypothetical protein [Planctomycetota bacterium]